MTPASDSRPTSELTGMIDRNSPIPMHYQLREALRARVQAGEWGLDALLPGETALMAQTGVSRSVVRQALGDLVRDGVLERRRGIGTFVARPKITEGFAAREVGFHEDMVRRGHVVNTRIVEQRIEPASARVASDLNLALGAPVVLIGRVRSVDGVATVFVESWLDAGRFAWLLKEDLTDVSLYRLLFERAGVRAGRSRRILSASLADRTLAPLLGIRVGDPLVSLSSVSYQEPDDGAFEVYRAFHRADRTRFEFDASRTTDLRELGPNDERFSAVPLGA